MSQNKTIISRPSTELLVLTDVEGKFLESLTEFIHLFISFFSEKSGGESSK